jgi:hypothetical protein
MDRTANSLLEVGNIPVMGGIVNGEELSSNTGALKEVKKFLRMMYGVREVL